MKLLEFQAFQPIIEQRPLLSPLTHLIEEGEFVVLTGCSGAGKTRLLETLVDPTLPHSGSLIISSAIVTVPQSLDLCLTLSAVENAALASLEKISPWRSLFGIDPTALAEASTHLSALGIKNQHQPVGLMSGGEQQRVALARLLLSDRKLWLLDEPVSQLDDRTALSCLQYTKTLAKQQKAAVLCVLHQENLSTNITDKTLHWDQQWKIA